MVATARISLAGRGTTLAIMGTITLVLDSDHYLLLHDLDA
jgi:hypothetical protein